MAAYHEALDHLEAPVVVRHRLTVHDYHRMAETGVLPRSARVELINGEIVEMATFGTKHYWAVLMLTRLLVQAVGERAFLAPQLPLRLDDYNEPEPDIVLLRPSPGLRAKALPEGSDAILVIEVSDSTLAYDFKTKSPLYAGHGVAEYWIVDLRHQRLHKFRQAEGGQWAHAQTLDSPGVVELPGLDGIHVDLTSVY